MSLHLNSDAVALIALIVSLAALLGGACMIFAVSRGIRLKMLQLWGFVALGILLEVVGAAFHPLIVDNNGAVSNRHWGLVVLYFFCQFCFNAGANSTTFMVGPSLSFTHADSSLHNLMRRAIAHC